MIHGRNPGGRFNPMPENSIPGNYPQVYVIVLNYNGIELIGACLASLQKTTYPSIKVLVVDNASADGSPDLVKRDFPRVEMLLNSENYFFCKGNNIGMEYALKKGADYLFILNNDTTVDPECISKLVGFMEARRDAGGCQPLLCFMDRPDLIASAGCNIALSGKAWDARFGEPATSMGDEPVEMPGITGGAMFLRAETVRSAGMFCEKFQMYFEDVDLSLRIREKGYSLFCIPTARVLHKVSATTNKFNAARRAYFCERNSYWVVLRNFSPGRILQSYFLHLPMVVMVGCYNLLRMNFIYGFSIFKAMVIGVGSFFIYYPAMCLSALRSKKHYPFWPLIDNRLIYPPECKRLE